MHSFLNLSSRPLKSPNCVQLAFKSCISARERRTLSRERNPLLFSWLLWSSNWKTRFLQCGWFCKQRVKTKLGIRLQKVKKERPLGSDEMRCRTEGVGVDSKVRSLHVWCLEKKSQVPEEVPQSPWPPVWGCGMQSRPWHPPCGSPEEFSNFTSLTHFSFLAHFRLSKEVHSADRISTFSGGSRPEDFDVGFVSWR